MEIKRRTILVTHDPSIMKEGKTWYVFATGRAPGGGQLAVRCSADLEHWKLCGHVFDAIPAWILERSPGTKDLWPPDISYLHHEYQLYYAYSLFGKKYLGYCSSHVRLSAFLQDPDFNIAYVGNHGLHLQATDDFNDPSPGAVQGRRPFQP
jgi:arabinan endo-1,5-alpha-L-arabinosidase